MFLKSISIREANTKRKSNKGQMDDSDLNEPIDDSEHSTEEDASTEVQTTAMSNNGDHHPAQLNVASIDEMDNPLGETSSIEFGNGSFESEEQRKAVASSWGTTQQPSNSDKA